jgi:hypothetical protein
MIECPKENHPNSKYWGLQREEKEKLMVCPNDCSEDGSIKIDWRKPKRINLKRGK